MLGDDYKRADYNEAEENQFNQFDRQYLVKESFGSEAPELSKLGTTVVRETIDIELFGRWSGDDEGLFELRTELGQRLKDIYTALNYYSRDKNPRILLVDNLVLNESEVNRENKTISRTLEVNVLIEREDR